jgi:hypothetical protein
MIENEVAARNVIANESVLLEETDELARFESRQF